MSTTQFRFVRRKTLPITWSNLRSHYCHLQTHWTSLFLRTEYYRVELNKYIILFGPTSSIINGIRACLPFLKRLIIMSGSAVSSPTMSRVTSVGNIHCLSVNKGVNVTTTLGTNYRTLVRSNFSITLAVSRSDGFPISSTVRVLDGIRSLLNRCTLINLGFGTTSSIRSSRVARTGC